MTTQNIPQPSPEETEHKVSYLSKWLYVWIVLLSVAALVVVAFLIVIYGALHKVGSNVAVADKAVGAVRGNVSILPGQVHTVNSHLSAINENLKDVPARVGQINDSLGQVDTNLAGPQRSLADTAGVLHTTRRSLDSTNGALGKIEGSLRDTNGSLKDTGSVLQSVGGLAGRINTTLHHVDRQPNTLDKLPVSGGAAGIYQRVAVANGVLNPANEGVGAILDSLTSVNGHLKSTCEALVPQVLGLLPPDAGVSC